MDRSVAEMTNEEIEEEIHKLETYYAEMLGSNFDPLSLHKIWIRILELRNELQKRITNS
jgi:hypothetical protein